MTTFNRLKLNAKILLTSCYFFPLIRLGRILVLHLNKRLCSLLHSTGFLEGFYYNF